MQSVHCFSARRHRTLYLPTWNPCKCTRYCRLPFFRSFGIGGGVRPPCRWRAGRWAAGRRASPPPPPSTRPPALPSICNASLRAAQSHHSFPLTGGAIFFRILHSAGASTSLNIDPFYVNCHYNDHLDIAGLKFQFVYFTGNLFFNGLVEYRIVSQKNQPNG